MATTQTIPVHGSTAAAITAGQVWPGALHADLYEFLDRLAGRSAVTYTGTVPASLSIQLPVPFEQTTITVSVDATSKTAIFSGTPTNAQALCNPVTGQWTFHADHEGDAYSITLVPFTTALQAEFLTYIQARIGKLESGLQAAAGSKSANTVYAGPATGSAAAPTFRALVDADIPSGIARDSEVTAALAGYTSNVEFLARNPRVLYVSTGGNDTTGNGSEAAPVASLQKASDIIAASSDADWLVLIGSGSFAFTSTSATGFVASKRVVLQGLGPSLTTVVNTPGSLSWSYFRGVYGVRWETANAYTPYIAAPTGQPVDVSNVLFPGLNGITGGNGGTVSGVECVGTVGISVTGGTVSRVICAGGNIAARDIEGIFSTGALTFTATGRVRGLTATRFVSSSALSAHDIEATGEGLVSVVAAPVVNGATAAGPMYIQVAATSHEYISIRNVSIDCAGATSGTTAGPALIQVTGNRSSRVIELENISIDCAGVTFDEPGSNGIVMAIWIAGNTAKAMVVNPVISGSVIPMMISHPSADSYRNTSDQDVDVLGGSLLFLHGAVAGPNDVKAAAAIFSRGTVQFFNTTMDVNASAATSTSGAKAYQAGVFASRGHSAGTSVVNLYNPTIKFNGTSTNTGQRGAIVVDTGSDTGAVSGTISNPTFAMGANYNNVLQVDADLFDVSGVINCNVVYTEDTPQSGGGIVLPATLGTDGQILQRTGSGRDTAWVDAAGGGAPAPLYVTTSDYTFLETDSGAVALIPGTATAVLTLPDDPVNGFELTLHAENGAGFRLDPGSSSYAEPIYALGVEGSDPLTSYGGGSLYLKFNADLSKWVILPGSSGWVVWTP
jgi:hypothetical protein